jgi:hypothetical protein
VAGVLGAGITALAGRISRPERVQIAKAKGYRNGPAGSNGPGNGGGLVREILADRARIDREHLAALDELRAAHAQERAADQAEATARLAEQAATIRRLRRRLDECEARHASPTG